MVSTWYIGSGEAASYRRLPPSEPQGPFKARTPARPDRAVWGIARMMRAILFLEGGAMQDVADADLDLREAERSNRLGEDHGAGHDGRRTVGMKAPHLPPLLER